MMFMVVNCQLSNSENIVAYSEQQEASYIHVRNQEVLIHVTDYMRGLKKQYIESFRVKGT
jgi:hypothetical protein